MCDIDSIPHHHHPPTEGQTWPTEGGGRSDPSDSSSVAAVQLGADAPRYYHVEMMAPSPTGVPPVVLFVRGFMDGARFCRRDG